MKASIKYLGALALTLVVSSAQAVPLSELLAGGSITAGDKVFDEWRLISEVYSDAALTVNPANIEVTPLNDGGMDPGPGLSFTVGDEFSVAGDGLYAFIDYMFGFRVTAPAGVLIKDNSLVLGSTILVTPPDALFRDKGVVIQEFVGTTPDLVEVPGDTSLPDLAVKEVEFSDLEGVITDIPSDSAAFAPHSVIYVSKDILVWASGIDESATLTGFSQRFSQTTVPEPGVLALVGVGLMGVWNSRRRPGATKA